MTSAARSADRMAFTEANYIALLDLARSRYRFEPFGTQSPEPHVLWRHDIDYSVHRAQRIARIEAEAGISATYFFLLTSPYYSLLEPATRNLARGIIALGHHAGLHFDPTVYQEDGQRLDLEDRIAFERGILEDLLGRSVTVMSFHNPAYAGLLDMTEPTLGGVINAYGGPIRERYVYASDSFGYWRHTPIPEVMATTADRLHILTHPVWWTPEGASPRQKIARCVDGRAAAMQKIYDDLMKSAGTWEKVMSLEGKVIQS